MKITIEEKIGSEKTNIAFKIAEVLAYEHSSVKYMVPKNPIKSIIELYGYVPVWIQIVNNTNQVFKDDLVIFDEVQEESTHAKTVIVVKTKSV